MKKIILVLAIGISIAAHAQRSNTRYADQFYNNGVNPTVGAMVTAAQNSCEPSQPCVVIIDTALAGWATGVLPTPCVKCTWLDYRTAGSVMIASNTSPT